MMPIAFKCSDCGKSYKVKTELAGKQFKCKECGEPLRVPRPKRPKRPSQPKPSSPDDDDDFMNALSEVSEDDYETLPTAPTAPRSRKKPSSKKKKRKTQKAASVRQSWFYRAIMGFLAAFFVIRTVMFLLGMTGSHRQRANHNQSTAPTTATAPATIPGESGMMPAARVSGWQEFTSPDKIYTVQMPDRPTESSQLRGSVIETHYRAKNNNIAVDVSHARYPVPGSLLDDNKKAEMLNGIRQMFQRTPGVTIQKETPISLGEFRGKEFVLKRGPALVTIRAYPAYSYMILVQIVSKASDPKPELISKVFNSFKILDLPPEEEPVAKLKPYLERRKAFQTKLLVKEPAPQQFAQETPPQGVEEIVYQSGNLKLKAWFDKRGAKSNSAPALVFLHGGFAFGADDLEACKPFRDAGFIVLTPMLRGENGNPGYFELFYGEVDDAAAACRWLAEQAGVDKQRIYAFGHSAGGGVSSLLSLRDDAPISHSGSVGGVYPKNLAAIMSDIVPFDTSNPEEVRLRLLVGNIQDMQHRHYAYTGRADSILSIGMNQAKKEAGDKSLLTTEAIPGDHFSSFHPALLKYLQLIQSTL